MISPAHFLWDKEGWEVWRLINRRWTVEGNRVPLQRELRAKVQRSRCRTDSHHMDG